ncbi:carboxymuconolactone decarboxylase family protein [Bosea sp. ASV33]|uniref:carboxymuconolactone decarboxylase family protein n=1 Tax=Bosea sp. ASV33 TaxID=2795106 RepID=UPI0018ED8915|nr:carboxymuconolactone decarboxylase family protein [Bosea sp. ASV33]
MGRLHLPTVDEMTADQRKLYDEVVSGPRGRLVGPLRAVIHSPELATRWSRLGEFLRYATLLPARLNELAIIVVGRHWNSQLEFFIHAEAAKVAGLGADCIEAIRLGHAPAFAGDEEREIYDYARLLVQTGTVPDDVHEAIVARWGPRGAVELTGVIGYYTMVSMTLNAHGIPLPDGAAPPLPKLQDGPTRLPAALQQSEETHRD